MTRVYENPAPPPAGNARTRALIVGAGRYDHAKTGAGNRPILADLSSVAFSVNAIVRRLILNWNADLEAPLASVDMLLSSADVAGKCKWVSLGVAGEIAADSEIDPPTIQTLGQALESTLHGSTAADHLIVYFCGHGFWKGALNLFLSDFGSAPMEGWNGVVNLDALRTGLRTKPPRRQWIFQDCCSELAKDVFDLINDDVGDPIIRASGNAIMAANALGTLVQYSPASSSPGNLAFGHPGNPTRFAEMLIEAIDGSGAVSRPDGRTWRVSNTGIDRAMETYALRNIDLANPEFYNYARPTGPDSGTIFLRRTTVEPKSCYIGVSEPAFALKRARVRIETLPDKHPILDWREVGRSRLKHELPARKDFGIEIVFANGTTKSDVIFSALPLAEPEEARFDAGPAGAEG